MHSVKPGSSGLGAAYSAVVGRAASAPLPKRVRSLAYRAFARAVGANLDETELELGEYASLGDFFARRLREGAREVDAAPDAIVSPSDGAIAANGLADAGALVQAKGHDYRLADLLADEDYARAFDGGAYVTIYLSPRDYHRVHAPVAGRLLGYDYIPGALWPVNPKVVARRAGVFSKNERVVIRVASEEAGQVAVVMVGAAGVGNIVVTHGPSSVASRNTGEVRRVELDGERVERGGELGAFRLGSTVILVFQPGRAHLALPPDGAAVRFGERIGTMRGA